MKIFLDDLRLVDMSHNSNKGIRNISNFVIARNDREFIKIVDSSILSIDLVSFDHDLACYNNGIEFTGKNACEYLIDKCIEYDRKFPDWYVHSDNTCGRDNIIGLILNYIKKIDNVDISGYRYYHRGYVNGQFID